jgi:hypothetical protein
MEIVGSKRTLPANNLERYIREHNAIGWRTYADRDVAKQQI